MSRLLQRLLSSPPRAVQRCLTKDLSVMGIAEAEPSAGVLAVTADLRFYSGILDVATSDRWRSRWARTLDRAVEVCTLESLPVIIYDVRLPGVDWTQAFDALSRLPNRPRLLLAAHSVDEPLWSEVLRGHGYDVVYRSAGSEELRRALRFAWLSLSALSFQKLTR